MDSIWRLVDDARVKRLNQHVGALIASVGGFALGVSLGWNSSASNVLRMKTSATNLQIALISVMLNVGASLGALLTMVTSRATTRPTTMFLALPVIALGWLFICFAEQEVARFIIGRFLCGVGGGIFCVLTPLFVAEIAERENRCQLLTVFQLLINFGIFYAFLVDYLLEERDDIWRYSIVCAIPTILIAAVLVLPETPIYFLQKSNEESAKRSLIWYRGNSEGVESELDEMKEFVASREQASCGLLKNKNVLRSLSTAAVIIFAQQSSAVNIVIFFALAIFDAGGSGYLTGGEQTLIVGAVQILSCILAALLIKTFGQRIMLTASSALVAASLVFFAFYLKERHKDPEIDDLHGWIPTAATCLLFAGYNLGIGPIAWAFAGDTFPIEIRTRAAASAAALSWSLLPLTMAGLGEMLAKLGTIVALLVFGVCSTFAAILCAVFVRNTTKWSLIEIQESFAIESPDTTDRSRVTKL